MRLGIRAVPYPGDVSIGPDQHRGRGWHGAEVWKLPVASMLSVEQLNAICPGTDVEGAGFAKVEEHRPGIVEQGEDAQGAVGGDQVEVGHAASEQGVFLAEVRLAEEPKWGVHDDAPGRHAFSRVDEGGLVGVLVTDRHAEHTSEPTLRDPSEARIAA